MKKITLLSIIAASLSSSVAMAASVTGHVNQELAKAVAGAQPGIDVVLTHKDPVSGLNMVRLATSEIFLTDDKGSFIVGGGNLAIYKNNSGEYSDTISPVNYEFNKKVVSELIGDTGILVKAANEKHQITAFIDPACGYCQKMHKELQSYLDLGISIKFVAFPIFGDKSRFALEAVMAEETPEKALKALYSAERNIINQQSTLEEFTATLSASTGKSKATVAKHTEAARLLGLKGTPGLVLKSGQTIASYVPAQKLFDFLEIQK